MKVRSLPAFGRAGPKDSDLWPRLEEKPDPYILDICCGTGAVITAFANQYP